MAHRLIALMGTKKIPLNIATEITVKGQVVARRLVDAIDPKLLEVTAQRVEAAYNGSIMFTDEEKDKITSITITSMPHPDSPMDPEWHISCEAAIKDSPKPRKAHVPINPALQQPAR